VAVLERCLGDAQLMEHLLRVFVRQAVEDSSTIGRAVSAGDAQKALRAAHRLKGAASNLALERIRESALALETHVRERGVPGADALVTRLQAELDALAAVLHA
jgi:HPt (histidine-containing phosphotransfer) domain-containing protein